jgi:hypothetical protein
VAAHQINTRGLGALKGGECMSTRYERDDSRRRVVITIQGAFQADDVLAIMSRQRREDTWGYATLWDLRGLTGLPTVADLRRMMSQAVQRAQGEGPRGKVALLATEPILYGKLCAYAALGQSTALTIEVFRDWDEAEQWLSESG